MMKTWKAEIDILLVKKITMEVSTEYDSVGYVFKIINDKCTDIITDLAHDPETKEEFFSENELHIRIQSLKEVK